MNCREMIMSEDYVDLIEDTSVNTGLQQVFEDYCVQELNQNTTLIYVSAREAGAVFPSAEMFSILPRCYAMVGETEGGIPDFKRYDLLALSRSGISEVQKPPLSLTGEGCVWAMIGPGIDYTNPLFRKEDGSSRILAIWDQSESSGKTPQEFSYGREYTREEINQALLAEEPFRMIPNPDANGYGTLLAAAAAGQLKDTLSKADLENPDYQSPAPKADIIVVKLKEAKEYLKDLYCIFEGKAYQENDIMTAFQYVRSFVQVARRGVTAFCMLGTTMGNHGGNGPLDRYLTQLLNIRNFSVIWCGGDEGNTRHHYEGFFEAGDNRQQEIELNVSDGCSGFMLQFWAEKPAVFQLTVKSPGGESTGLIQGKRVDFRRYDFVYGSGYLTVSYSLAEDNSGWQCAIFRFVQPLPGIWKIQVTDTDRGMESSYHMWLPMSAFLNCPVFFPISSPYVTLVSPVSGRGLITTGSYDLQSGSYPVWASRGYPTTREYIPDLAAPGENIMTILGLHSTSALAGGYVSGAVCQMMEWGIQDGNDPLLDGNEIRQYLLRGAERKTDLMYPNRELGYGTLNLSDSFQKIAGISELT